MIVAAVIQARMGSTRLPGKVLRPLGGRPVLGWLLRAVRDSGVADEIIVATTWRDADDPVAALAAAEGVAVCRGSEDDVLGRFCQASRHLVAGDLVIRVTGDTPLVDPALIRLLVATARATGADYTALSGAPNGVGVSVVGVSALRRADEQAQGYHRVHVTSHLYTNPADYHVVRLPLDPPAADVRVTLDTADDALLLEAVVAELGDRTVAWRDLVGLLRARPDLVALNAHVPQKDLPAG